LLLLIFRIATISCSFLWLSTARDSGVRGAGDQLRIECNVLAWRGDFCKLEAKQR